MTKFVLRESALNLLERIGEQGGYSHVLLDQEMNKRRLPAKDGALLTEIVYGTLQNKRKIEFQIEPYVAKQKKIKPWVKWLLYMSVYQMVYLERVPDHAVIHEAVEISKKRGHKGISSFMNGVLRNVQRKGVQDPSTIEDKAERISVETSHPEWLVSRWIEQYGWEVTEAMCHQNLKRLPISVRVQPLRMSRDEVITDLKERHITAIKSSVSEQGLLIEEGRIIDDRLFTDGFLTIQDQSSMLVGEMMDLKPGLKVLDACSAPGGKTTHIAEKLEDQGSVIAYDLHEKKAKLVNDKATLLQLQSIEARQADSRQLHDLHDKKTFDRILLDAPCSGLGVLRGKPDIKYHKSESDIFALRKIQDELLHSVAPLLKVEGKLIYSTCTVDRHENEEAVKQFLNNHHEFEVDPTFAEDLPEKMQGSVGHTPYGIQLFPHQWDTDGFFLTRLVKKKRSE
ncbi:16S rRNA (cytosine(967)-C(5))-methyltransferase RsmB [Halobacillus shinanisalinarum]|uniref:16S rRNA (cytosine(967)-C(5))-methyltransferase n=1 Tax=Halobacillus shinanisalinarum TaxID=2932258 RepID=A0ABY4H2H2_9BACI|nr:16S rRNA (cytosine(967)-C(5))-methyltransferase RsmB [Halobacillus shinanisalinarum]UOQ93172.1 16S rRNA (cytosine(967)-C(5))-methyltransferase RsmB [Halobacillus shinanisalinarum]